MNFVAVVLLSNVGYANELTLQTDHAVALHLSSSGLSQIGRSIQQIVPQSISIDAGQGTLECSSSTTLTYDLQQVDIITSIDNVVFTSQEDLLSVTIFGHLGSDPSTANVVGDCAVFEDLNEQCTLEIATTPFSLSLALEARLENGLFVTDVQQPTFSISPITNPLQNCLAADAVDTILGQNPNLISDLIRDAIEPELQGLPESIQEGLNDLIDDLSISETFEVLETEMEVNLSPSRISITETGVVLGLGSEITASVADACADVSLFEPPTQQAWPPFDGQIFGSQMSYDTGVFLSRHFIEQALYAAWASGALCLDVVDLTGLDLTGEFAATFFGDEFGELVGTETIDLRLTPQAPFSVAFSDDQPPLSIVVDDWALEAYGPVLSRSTRLLQVNLDSEIGIVIEQNGNSLYPELPLSVDDFFFEEAYSEMLSAGYSEGVPALLNLGLSSFLQEDLLPTIHFPSPLGLQFEALVWESDADQEWLGAHVHFNTEEIQPFVPPGCSASDLGCDGGGPQIDIDVDQVLGCDDLEVGCEGGCAQQGRIRLPAGRIFGLVLVLCTAMMRRRE